MKFSLYEQFALEIKSLKNNYPEFITSSKPLNLNKGIPVFVFHTIEPKHFEKQLNYISSNKYNTLSINEYFDIITKKKTAVEKSILLTFDDGRSSFWRFAFPLLKKYNIKATLFIIPGITPNNNYSNNLEDVWKNKKSLKEIISIDPDDKCYCSWKELKEMYNSNLVDIESHTLMHKVVFISDKVIDFIDEHTHDSILTAYRSLNKINTPFNREEYFGFPVFNHEAMLKGNVNYKVEENLINYCRNFYIKHKSVKNWKHKLFKELNSFKKQSSLIKSRSNVENEISEDFKLSMKLIKEFITDSAGNHLCLPWTTGSDMAIKIAKDAGYKSVFWGALNKKINKPGDDPYYNCRIKNDFIFRLPGYGRKKLFNIYISKLTRRLKSEPVY